MRCTYYPQDFGRCAIVFMWVAVVATAHGAGNDADQLNRLAQEMDAHRARVRVMQATTIASQVQRQDDDHAPELLTWRTNWVKHGDCFRHTTEFRQTTLDQEATETGTLEYTRAICDGVFLEYSPTRERAVLLREQDWVRPERHHLREHDPLYFGWSIYGFSLSEMLAGAGDIRLERRGEPVEWKLTWEGMTQFQGREVHVVSHVMSWRWQNDRVSTINRTVYIDPQRGYTVPYIWDEFVTLQGVRVVLTVHTECVEYADGIWGPLVTTYQGPFSDLGKGYTTFTVHIINVAIDPVLEGDGWKVTLPEGTAVDDHIRNITFEYSRKSHEDVLQEIKEFLEDVGLQNRQPNP